MCLVDTVVSTVVSKSVLLTLYRVYKCFLDSLQPLLFEVGDRAGLRGRRRPEVGPAPRPAAEGVSRRALGQGLPGAGLVPHLLRGVRVGYFLSLN